MRFIDSDMSAIEAKVQLLANTWLFQDTDRAELEKLAIVSERRTILGGRFLWRRSREHEDALALIIEGQLDVLRGEVILRRVEKDFVGVASAANASQVTADVAAPRPAELLVVPGDAFRSLLDRDPRVARRVIERLTGLLTRLTDELEDQALPLYSRLARKLLRLAEAGGSFQPRIQCTHRELASMLQASAANVTRAIGKLRTNGVLGAADEDGVLIVADEALLRLVATE